MVELYSGLRQTFRCVKSIQMLSFFWSLFFCIQSEHRKIRTSKITVSGHFLRSDSTWSFIGGLHGNSEGIGAVNCCHLNLHPSRRSYPRFSSFLCKCNPTKNYFTSVSLLKHFSISCWFFFPFCIILT